MKTLLITDVDNTLLDWQHLWFQTFGAMARKAIEISGVSEARFYAECSAVHQKYGTSEYAFVLGELPCLVDLYGGKVIEHMQPAIDAFREARRASLSLYPGVSETLQKLKGEGATIVAYTESQAFYTNYRFRKLGLDGLIDALYSPQDHDLPEDAIADRKYDNDHYRLKHTEHRFTPPGEHKPNPHILLTIVGEMGFTKSDTLYVGDKLLKDVYMAQQAGVLDVFARYGAAEHREEEYDLLRAVTHWTPEMVERERAALKPGAVVPSHTLESSFAEIISIMGSGS